MPSTKWADLAAFECPGRAEAKAGSSGARCLSSPLGQGGREESRELAATRDELLPLLMSGKVRVKDAEKSLEEVL